MKWIDEFRSGTIAQEQARLIASEASQERDYAFMEFCGGHTHAIFRHGVTDLLPDNVRMVHGPGCPVCVLPISRLEGALTLARQPNTILCTYADMMRVPATKGMSLLKARAEGHDVRAVHSVHECLDLARKHPAKEVVFFAIGFETTTPPTAVAVKVAHAEGLRNFSVYCNHVLTPPAIMSILDSPEVRSLGTVPLHGFIGPAHVSAVIGSQPYEYFAQEYRKPVVIAGFEPLDIMQAILMLVRQCNAGRAQVENEYNRAVTRDGNKKAKALVAEIFELRKSFEWRGLGTVPYSGLQLREEFASFDAERRFSLKIVPVPDHKACICGAVLRGLKAPEQCPVFAKACTPDSPLGSCMVSSEGACAAHYNFRLDATSP